MCASSSGFQRTPEGRSERRHGCDLGGGEDWSKKVPSVIVELDVNPLMVLAEGQGSRRGRCFDQRAGETS